MVKFLVILAIVFGAVVLPLPFSPAQVSKSLPLIKFKPMTMNQDLMLTGLLPHDMSVQVYLPKEKAQNENEFRALQNEVNLISMEKIKFQFDYSTLLISLWLPNQSENERQAIKNKIDDIKAQIQKKQDLMKVKQTLLLQKQATQMWRLPTSAESQQATSLNFNCLKGETLIWGKPRDNKTMDMIPGPNQVRLGLPDEMIAFQGQLEAYYACLNGVNLTSLVPLFKLNNSSMFMFIILNTFENSRLKKIVLLSFDKRKKFTEIEFENARRAETYFKIENDQVKRHIEFFDE